MKFNLPAGRRARLKSPRDKGRANNLRQNELDSGDAQAPRNLKIDGVEIQHGRLHNHGASLSQAYGLIGHSTRTFSTRCGSSTTL